MRIFLIFLFLLLTHFSFAQQEIKKCDGEKTNFTYSTYSIEPGTYWWELDGQSYQINKNNIIIDWSNYDLGIHKVQAFFISDDGCYAKPLIFEVSLIDCPQSTIWFPNSFIPNYDGHNETWFPVFHNITSINIRIFNRWGELLYQTNDINGSWNGYYQNKICEIGVYVFLASWTTIEGEGKTKFGYIFLIN